jgi:hypothetical protein
MTLEEGMMLLFEVWEKKDANYDQSSDFNKVTDSFIAQFQEHMGKREVKQLAKYSIGDEE